MQPCQPHLTTSACRLALRGAAPPTPRRAAREKSSWKYLRFPEAAVTEDLPAVLRTIEQAVERLGGPARAS